MRKMAMILTLVVVLAAIAGAAEIRKLPVAEYLDKMKAGWIGQMAGVGWGAPTEFHWQGKIVPASEDAASGSRR